MSKPVLKKPYRHDKAMSYYALLQYNGFHQMLCLYAEAPETITMPVTSDIPVIQQEADCLAVRTKSLLFARGKMVELLGTENVAIVLYNFVEEITK